MNLFLIVLIPILAFSVWAFFWFTPSRSSQRIAWYNAAVIVAGVSVCAAFSLWLRSQMIEGTDFGWWPVLAVLGSLVVFPTWLLFGGCLRNFVFFRQRR